MESVSSTLSVSNASTAVGTGRSKVVLRPGHSLMDWIRFTHSGQDLATNGGKCLEISPRELAKHNTKNDAWIALNGRVYNITHYLDYHPGGEEELMCGAGKDATDLFNQVHRWVNAESMLQKCLVGFLKKSWSLDVPRFSSIKPLKKVENVKIIPECTPSNSPGSVRTQTSNGSSEWYTVSSYSVHSDISLSLCNEDKVILKIVSLNIRSKELILELIKECLFIKLNKDSSQWLNIKLSGFICKSFEVEVFKNEADKDSLKIYLYEGRDSYLKESKVNLMWTLCDKDTTNLFWSCKLVKKCAINYNTHLFTFLLPSNIRMWVPIGCHVLVKSDIEGVEIIRSYTPVIHLNPCEENDFSDGCHIMLMIKIYPSGTLTPFINICDTGEDILISNYTGAFSVNLLERCDSLIMVAAGTGITPMIKIIAWALTAKDKKRPVLLLFFNKTEEDILWRTELEKYSKALERFRIVHILSESNNKWNSFSGTITEDILRKILPAKQSNSEQVLICGPLLFTKSAVKLFVKVGYSQEYVYAFTG